MSRLIRSLVLCSLVAGVAGCPSDWGSTPNQNHYTRLSGRILNGETQLPLSGVVVKICDFEATGSTDGDGHWFIELIPGIVDASVRMTFERSGFGALGQNVGIFPDTGVFEGNLQERQFIDLGTMWMRPGVPVTAHVTRDGVPLAGAVLYAMTETFAYGPQSLQLSESSSGDCTDLNIVGTTNASGVATMNNFDPTLRYEFVVPKQDLDGDGIPDIGTATSSLEVEEDGDVISIDTQTFVPDTGPDITGNNLVEFRNSFDMPTGTVDGDDGRVYYQRGNADLNTRQFYQGDEVVDFHEGVVTANGSVQVVFWNPVSITGANFRWRNNLVAFSDPDWNMDLRINATATALAGSDSTIFNFVPLSPLPLNEVVNLNFIARSLVEPSSSSNLDIGNIYVPLHLGTIPFALDNYNGSLDQSGGSNSVYLRFNEAVEGFYKVLEYHGSSTTTTFENPFEISFNQDDQIINNEEAAPLTGSNLGQSGVVAGKAYTVRLVTPDESRLFLNDDFVDDPTTVTIEISARNIVGVTLDGVFTLPVE